MINKQVEFDSEAVHLHINLLQIEKRRSGALSEKSVISLMDLIRQAEGVGDIEKPLNFCAEVLLEDAGEAKKWLDRMDNSEHQNVKDYPIMNLYQDLVSTNDEEDVIEYVNIPTTGMSVEDWEKCSVLFSTNYGNYSEQSERFDKLIVFSEKQLRDAYSRMKLDDQGWAKGKENEVAYIEQWSRRINAQNIIDLGCGNGRHSIALARDGYHVCGVDYSDTHIHAADKALSNESITGTCRFVCADLRDYEDEDKS